jgi:uncharacterized protein YigE (DUF2233 family)
MRRMMQPVREHGIRFANVAEVDLSQWDLRTVSAQRVLHKPLATLPELMQASPGAVVGINAGFFKVGEEPVFVGYFVEDGRLVPHREGPRRIFFITEGGKAGIVRSAEAIPKGVRSAVAGYSGGGKDDPTARSAVCITAAGTVKLLAVYPVPTLVRMTGYLTEAEGCADYVHLDGGGSTQFVLRTEGGVSVGWEREKQCYAGAAASPPECFRKVADAQLAFPK